MNIRLSSDALTDLEEGFMFYQQQLPGLGGYFKSSLIADIESLTIYAGVHPVVYGYHRALSKRFPFCIYYQFEASNVTVVAVLDARRNPKWTSKRLR